jgi:hypothetical protein
MAIPPILANNPIVKMFRSEQTLPDNNEAGRLTQQTPEDIVEISEIAQQRLAGIETLSSDEPARIAQVTSNTADILSDNQTVSLGLDPGFNE